MIRKALQDDYPDELSQCYTCGRLNQDGLQIRSYWDGEEAICLFQPQPYHIAIPGFVNGGVIASVIDCHCIATALAQSYGSGRQMFDQEPLTYFLTASLHIDYLRPTPLGPILEIRARVKEKMGRKVMVAATVSVQGEVTARGEVIAVQVSGPIAPNENAT
jgi:acyl-coenzyme A thioesterase PaaI-like protein